MITGLIPLASLDVPSTRTSCFAFGLVDADYGCNDPREERVTATLMRSYGEAMAGLAPFRLGVSPLQTSRECDGRAIGTR